MTTMNDAERAGFELASVDDSFGSLRALGAEAEHRGLENGDYIDFAARKAWEYFQAGAAWQRAQGAVPEKKVESVRWGYRSLGYAEGWNACVDALLAAAPATPAAQGAVPDGYALVPVEPTPAMRVIGARDCSSLIRPDQAGEVWRAMLGAVVVPAEYAFAAPAHPAERQGQKGPDWKRRSEQGWQTAAMYRAENQELKARLEAALLDGDSLAQQLHESEELLWLAHKCFGDQKAIRSGERGASDRQQAQNRIFKWLDARRMERVAALAASTGQEVEL